MITVTTFRLIFAFLLVSVHPVFTRRLPRPHIIVIMADDLGWADVSFHGSTQIPTPNLDVLAADGILLNNYYVQPLCTPSRAALLTGLYPIRTGMQSSVINHAEPWGLPLNLKIMPQHFRDLGYATHLVGKWHLGYFQEEYTPVYRGFDSFFGYYNGFGDYYKHTTGQDHFGLDFRDGKKAAWEHNGTYTTHLFTEKAISIIENHESTKPLFLYLAHMAVHSGVEGELQAPSENVARFSYIGDERRTVFAGMVDVLDDSIGLLLKSLNKAGMLNDTIIVFSADNGANPSGYLPNEGCNWPLRGLKGTLWEGGIRVPAFVWSPRLNKKSRVSDQMMHVTDWLPTLFSAAGGDTSSLGPVDGFDMWDALDQGYASPREEILLNVDPLEGNLALRHQQYKVYLSKNNTVSDTFKIPGGRRPVNDLRELRRNSETAGVLRDFYKGESSWQPSSHLDNSGMVDCEKSAKTIGGLELGKSPFLFDIEKDPCELNNLAKSEKKILRKLMKRLSSYVDVMVPPGNKPDDPRAFPEFNCGAWSTWLNTRGDTLMIKECQKGVDARFRSVR